MGAVERLRFKMRLHYQLASMFQALTEHYSRLTKIDCAFYDSEVTEGIVVDFTEELEEYEDGMDAGEIV